MNEKSYAYESLPEEIKMQIGIVCRAIESNTFCPNLHYYITDDFCRMKYEEHFKAKVDWPIKRQPTTKELIESIFNGTREITEKENNK